MWAAAFSGSHATDTTEIYQEGLQLRSVKVYKRGLPDEEIVRIIRHNIRFPELSFGDMAAQIAACSLVSERWLAMVRKYGWPVVEASDHAIWDQSEAFVRQQICALPDGRCAAERSSSTMTGSTRTGPFPSRSRSLSEATSSRSTSRASRRKRRAR